MIVKKENKLTIEIILTLYYFSFMMLKPILHTYAYSSTLVLFLSTLLLTLCYFLKSNFKLDVKNVFSFFIITLIILLLFSISYTINPFNTVNTYLYYFFIYGIVPLLYLINIRQFDRLLLFWSKLSIYVGIAFLSDPFMLYKWSGDYMAFGFNVMLPAFSGSIIFALYYRKKFAYILSLLFFIELFIFGNKGAIVAGLTIFFVGYVYFSNKGFLSWEKLFFIVLAVFIAYFYRENILGLFFSIAKKLSVNSYSLNTLKTIIYSNNNDVFSSRTNIWFYAWQLFTESPIIGHGIGYFESITGAYVHNIFLDILVSSGIFGITVFIGIFTISLIKIFRFAEEARRIFSVLMLVLWFVPMLFSMTMWEVMPFWIYWGVAFSKIIKHNKKEENQ